MEKLLVICGPTATGKTKLALNLAHQFDGELISADSRQVYKGLDLLTGKERPVNSDVPIWMYDVVEPHELFSVSQYQKAAQRSIDEITQRKKLPIAVGGTGLYLKAITQPLSHIHIPPNQELREKFEGVHREVLQKELQKIDKEKWKRMNQSDQNNPRRLIRAIEIAYAPHQVSDRDLQKIDILWVGLTAPFAILEQKIKERVMKRWEQGVVDEVRKVKRPVSVLGFSFIEQYIQGKLSKEEVVRFWVREEYQYAKRQLTWFKKQSNIHWYDITHAEYEKEIKKLVSTWYTEKNDIKD